MKEVMIKDYQTRLEYAMRPDPVDERVEILKKLDFLVDRVMYMEIYLERLVEKEILIEEEQSEEE